MKIVVKRICVQSSAKTLFLMNNQCSFILDDLLIFRDLNIIRNYNSREGLNYAFELVDIDSYEAIYVG